MRSVDQREAFIKDVVYNSPAPSVASSRRSSVASSRKPSTASTTSRRAKRSGLILVTDQIKTWSDDEEESSMATAITCSSISSVRRRSSSGRALRNKLDNPSARKRSLQSGWWDEETDSEDDESPSVPVMARRVALTPSKRSIENMKGVFDPSFSFSRRCLTSSSESVDPLDTCTWF